MDDREGRAVTTPIYEFCEDDARNGEAGILITEHPDCGFKLTFSGDDSAHERADIEQMRQEYATAIADWMIADAARLAVLDFAERVAAWLTSDDSDDEFHRTVPMGTSRTEWDAAQILAAARGERTLP